MKYSVVALVASISFVNAQVTIANIPACAQSCITTAVQSDTDCAITDIACICANQAAVTSGASSCVLSSCTPADAATTLQVTGELCAQVSSSGAAGSSTSVPASTVPASSVPASTTVVTSSVPESSSAAATTTVASSTVVQATTSESLSTVSSVSSSSVVVVGSSTVATVTSGVATSSGAGVGGTTSTGSSVPVFSGAANANRAVGGVFAAAVAAAAML